MPGCRQDRPSITTATVLFRTIQAVSGKAAARSQRCPWQPDLFGTVV